MIGLGPFRDLVACREDARRTSVSSGDDSVYDDGPGDGPFTFIFECGFGEGVRAIRCMVCIDIVKCWQSLSCSD